jgi:hypothetical protein
MGTLGRWWHRWRARLVPGGFDLRNVMGEPVPVDGRIEPTVRRALEAVVREDLAGLDAALSSFPDKASRMQGLHLTWMIARLVLYDMSAGKPAAEEIRASAPVVATMTGWAGVSAGDVVQFYDGVLDGKLFTTTTDLDEISRIFYVTTGWLLASSMMNRRGEWWSQYLDRLEAALEAGPTRGATWLGRLRRRRRRTTPADLGLDDRVEPLVRNALAAAIVKDPDRLGEATLAFSDAMTLIKGMRLTAALAVFVVTEHYRRRPSDAELAKFAAGIAAWIDWADITADEIITWLTAAYDGQRVDDLLPMGRVIALSFVVTANLLGLYRDVTERWWDYLDRAEAIIEAMLRSSHQT